jgi:hypothetical protein
VSDFLFFVDPGRGEHVIQAGYKNLSRTEEHQLLMDGDGQELLDIKRVRPLTLIAALPVVLFHSSLINAAAMAMSIVGGLLIYGTVISFGMFFQEDSEF